LGGGAWNIFVITSITNAKVTIYRVSQIRKGSLWILISLNLSSLNLPPSLLLQKMKALQKIYENEVS